MKRELFEKALFAVFVFTLWISQTPAHGQANPDAGDVTGGLVGHWRLDELAGSSFIDSAGTNDGTGVSSGGFDAVGMNRRGVNCCCAAFVRTKFKNNVGSGKRTSMNTFYFYEFAHSFILYNKSKN